MIVLDAGVLIALFDAEDAHHSDAERIFTSHIDQPMMLSPLTLAEVLVRAARDGVESRMDADIRALGISTTPLPDDAGIRLARLRAHTGSTLPDCCVLLTAEQTNARIATFDTQLRRAALSRSVGLV